MSMEYSRKINIADGRVGAHTINLPDKVLDYGSIFLPSQVQPVDSPSLVNSSNPLGVNVAELLLSRGFANITRHRDYEERSHYYDALLAAYSRAEKAKKGYHSKKEYPVTHMNDLTMVRLFLLLFFSTCFVFLFSILLEIPIFLGSRKEGERFSAFVEAKQEAFCHC